MFAASALMVFFTLLAWERMKGGFFFDLPLLHSIHAVSNPAVVEASWWLARAGYFYGVLPVNALIVIALVVRHRRRDAFFAFVALWGGLLLNTVLKIGIQRVRPALDTVREVEMSYSFPSGHSMATAALAATAVALSWHTRWRWPVLLGSGAFAVLVGISRVHAGVHYPSDVAAGWAAGVAWVCVAHALVFWRWHNAGAAPTS